MSEKKVARCMRTVMKYVCIFVALSLFFLWSIRKLRDDLLYQNTIILVGNKYMDCGCTPDPTWRRSKLTLVEIRLHLHSMVTDKHLSHGNLFGIG